MAAANIHDVVSDDFDYEIWAPTTKSTLIEKGLWDVVENGVSPDPSKIPELAAKIQPEELSKWRDLAVKDMNALQILQSSLTDSAFRKTLSASSAKDVWDLLQKGYVDAKIRQLEKQFEELKRDEEESVDSYVDRIMEIVQQLRLLNIEKTEYQICKKVLASLSRPDDGFDSMLKELMEVHHMTATSLGVHFYSKGYKFDSVKGEDLSKLLKELRLKPKWCGVCHKNNHRQEDCKKKNQIDEDIWTVVYGDATIHMNHITPYEKYFTTLDKSHKAEVELDDGAVIKVEGRGDVKIKMKKGKKKTIKNVNFVPDFNRNMLSVRQMISRGYSFTEGRGGESIILDRTGEELGETMWMSEQKAWALRLQVIEGNGTSNDIS